jgi:7-keto-8-aminopelargonate synthetase-like enzyme
MLLKFYASMVWAAADLLVSMAHSVSILITCQTPPPCLTQHVLRIDVHIQLERDIADFLGTEAAILYSQGFSTISSVIPAFCKRGDIIVADRGVNFAIQKGIQISRSTVRWFDHNDLKSLEEVLESVEKERKKRRGPLTRRFIVTEGVFEKDGAMVDLPRLVSDIPRSRNLIHSDLPISD